MRGSSRCFVGVGHCAARDPARWCGDPRRRTDDLEAQEPATPATPAAEAGGARGQAPPEKKSSPIEITGFVDAYYGYNFLRPAGPTRSSGTSTTSTTSSA